jgi:hypothetical protein
LIRTVARAIEDPAVPAADVLLRHVQPRDLQAAVQSSGVDIRAASPSWVKYRPGRRIAVVYDAIVERRDGRSGKARLVAVADPNGVTGDAATVDLAGMPVAVWRYPRDPALPGLAEAASTKAVTRLLDKLHWPIVDLEVHSLAYQPTSHAVIEASVRVGDAQRMAFRPGRGLVDLGPERRSLFIKVMRPSDAEILHTIHERLREIVPVPVLLHADIAAGVLAFDTVPGTALGEWLRSGAARRPPAHEIVGLLDRIRHVYFDLPPCRPLTEDARRHRTLLRTVLPEVAARVERIADAIGEGEQQPLTTIHGDFHESQVMVRDGTVSGLLDLDDVGPGEHVDDLALMAGRVWTLARVQSPRSAELDAYADGLLADFERRVPALELRRRIAAAVLGRATGPFRVQAEDWPEQAIRRIELAEGWVDEYLAPLAAA